MSSSVLGYKPSGSAKARGSVEKSVLWAIVLIPLLAPALAVYLTWGRWVNTLDLEILGGMYLACALGITVGYHRMLTHRAFVPNPIVKFVFLALGTMSGMGPGDVWAVTHIQHHAHPDDDGDPHTPWDWVDKVKGIRKTSFGRFMRAHFLWIVYGEMPEQTAYSRELVSDPLVRFMSFWPVVLGFILLGAYIPYALGGVQGLLWGCLIRIGLTHHVTWSINSVCHVYGRRTFDTPDRSTNNWIFGILGLGEGWHNNHHAFPRSAFHGLQWYQVDLSGYIIRGMERVGLVKSVFRIPKATIEARIAKAQREE